MLEKPDIQNEAISAWVQTNYGIAVAALDFLPIGYDAGAAVYRLRAENGVRYFVKLKKGAVYPPCALVPRALNAGGIAQAVAPLPTLARALWTHVDDFTVLLYPFIEGDNAMNTGMSEHQWTEFGTILKAIHTHRLPADVAAQVPRETFMPRAKSIGTVRKLQADIATTVYDDALGQQVAAFWHTKHAEIQAIVERAEALGQQLQRRSLPFVLCHADIHTANVLLDPQGKLFIVDWDQPILAPKERDLMFIVDSWFGDGVPAESEAAFFRGYGATAIDWLALTYYCYEWVVQELGDFGEAVFLSHDVGEITRVEAAQQIIRLFGPDDVVAAAYAAEAHLRDERVRQF